MSVSGWTEVMRVLNSSEKLLEATLRGDEKSVAEGLDKAHTEVASILTYNDENSLACAISLVHHCINLEVIGRQSHMGLPVFGIGNTKNHSFVII